MMNYDFVNKHADATPAEILAPATMIEPFDVESAKKKFKIFESKIKDWAEKVESADIKNEVDAGLFTDTIANGKSLIKDLEKLRKEITGDAYKYYKDVLGFERYYTNMIEAQVVNPADHKLSFYFKQKEIEHKKAERLAQEAAGKKQIELDKLAEAAGVDKVKLDKPIFKEGKTKVVGAAGSASPKKKWLFKVDDFDKIPRSHLMVDDKSINRAIKNGERVIPGLVIYEETKAQVRARR
jgi:hypothetical protein